MRRKMHYDKGIGTHLVAICTTFCLLALLSGCPDFDLSDLAGLADLVDTGDDPNGSGPSDSLADDLSGRWRINETDFSNCGDSGSSRSVTWDVTQNGSSVTVAALSGNFALFGTISGNTLSLQGSFPQDGGTTTVTSANITVSASGNSISGSNTWNWSDGFDFCSGTTSLNGTRN